jgi:hypothetical protein
MVLGRHSLGTERCLSENRIHSPLYMSICFPPTDQDDAWFILLFIVFSDEKTYMFYSRLSSPYGCQRIDATYDE